MVGSISQSRFICQVVSTSIQKHLSSITGGPSDKVCLPSVVYWHSRHLCCIQGGLLDKVGSSARCCVLAFKASLLYPGGSIGQNRLICQLLCTGIQGIYALFVGGPLARKRFVCQVLVPLVGGGPLVRRRFIYQVLVLLVGGGSIGQKKGSSAKY